MNKMKSRCVGWYNKRMKIRLATEKDVKGIWEVDRDVLKAWSFDSYREEFANQSGINRRIYFVAEKSECQSGHDESQIVGFAGIKLIFDEGEITNVAVKKDFQGQGIGENIFGKILEYAFDDGCMIIRLEVRESNIAAINLYKKYGFQEEAVRTSYYDDGENALILWRGKDEQ